MTQTDVLKGLKQLEHVWRLNYNNSTTTQTDVLKGLKQLEHVWRLNDYVCFVFLTALQILTCFLTLRRTCVQNE